MNYYNIHIQSQVILEIPIGIIILQNTIISLFKFNLFLLSKKFLYDLSTSDAPIGAVIIIDATATVRIISPEASPIAKGNPPIAA